MKKIIALFCCLFISVSAAQAKSLDRKIVKDATVEQVEKIVIDTINMYDGVVAIKEINKKEHRYNVDYMGTTLTGIIGIKSGSDAKYPRASFSCQLKQKGDDVLIINRKVKYGNLWLNMDVFNHYEKIYNELKYAGYEIKKG
ncbi:MAG: hypothetical protein II304_03080 [Bacteroidales bacterium]|nr:hypothetical protein [Bacteroidales bacterium]